MVDTVRTQAALLAFLHPDVGNAAPNATVLQAQAGRDLIVSLPTLAFSAAGGTIWTNLSFGADWATVAPLGGAIAIGSDAAPSTSLESGLLVSRRSALPTPFAIDSGSIQVRAHNTGLSTTQVVGYQANMWQEAPGDIIGYYTVVIQDNAGQHNAYGFSANVNARGALSQAIGFEASVNNGTGSDQNWPGGGVWGYTATASGANRGTVGYLVADSGGHGWDVGVGILSGTHIGTAAFRDDSNAPVGVDIQLGRSIAGIRILDNSALYMQRWQRTVATTADWGLGILSSGVLTLDEFGVSQRLQLAPGAPGANRTSLSVAEGAASTMRQVRWKDGATIIAGDKVAVLV